MNEQELGERIVALTPLLYHVSYGLLRNEADREDAVQSAIEKAWRKASLLRDENKLKPWLTRILINECHISMASKAVIFPLRRASRGSRALLTSPLRRRIAARGAA